MELPMTPLPAIRVNPRTMVIYGLPKSGKTTMAAALTLDGKWCLFEFETGGADYVSATKIQINSPKHLKEIGAEIIAANKPYEGIIVDTVTVVEDLILPLAAQLYRLSSGGVNWTGHDVKTLPNGGGYLYLRQAFFQVIDYIETLADNIIYIGHVKSKLINKKGEEMESKGLDLIGKLSSLMCARVDAIAYCYRKDNETHFNFKASEELVTGGRCEHLKGADIIIANSDEKGKLTTYWDKVFLPE